MDPTIVVNNNNSAGRAPLPYSLQGSLGSPARVEGAGGGRRANQSTSPPLNMSKTLLQWLIPLHPIFLWEVLELSVKWIVPLEGSSGTYKIAL